MYLDNKSFRFGLADLRDVPVDKIEVTVKADDAVQQQLKEAKTAAMGLRLQVASLGGDNKKLAEDVTRQLARAVRAESAKAEEEAQTERWIRRFEGVSQKATDLLSDVRTAEKKYERLVDRIASKVSSYETKAAIAKKQGDLMGHALHDALMRAHSELLPEARGVFAEGTYNDHDSEAAR